MRSQIEFDRNFFCPRNKLVGIKETEPERFLFKFQMEEENEFIGSRNNWQSICCYFFRNWAQWSNLLRHFLNAKINSTELHNISILWQFTIFFCFFSARAYPFFAACAKTRKNKSDNSVTNKSSKKMRKKWTRARSSQPHIIVYVVPFSVHLSENAFIRYWNLNMPSHDVHRPNAWAKIHCR